MCTSVTLPLPDGTRLAGRTLDWHEHFGERIVHTPRRYPFTFGNMRIDEHPALLGVASVMGGYPLYAEAMNERGLSMAGLRFAGCAVYAPEPSADGEDTDLGVLSLAPWELIPYVLTRCTSVAEARAALAGVRVSDRPFPLPDGGGVPTTPLHWLIASDAAEEAPLVLEVTEAGLSLYDAPGGVMANHPPYPDQIAAERGTPQGTIPGGYDSPARFTRATRLAAAMAEALRATPLPEALSRADVYFGLIASVEPPFGVSRRASTDPTAPCQYTLYVCCMDGARGEYHYLGAGGSSRRTVAFADCFADTDVLWTVGVEK